jgi:branched-chain amino acid transport system substrate-binding protein
MFSKLKAGVIYTVLFGLGLCTMPSRAAEIVVGQIAPFTGLPSNDPKEVNEAAQAYFDQVNRDGGIAGNKISFFKLDDQFKPEVFKQQLAVALQRKAVALICPEGATILNMINGKWLDTADLIVVNAIPGADAFRNPGDPKLFHIRASDGDQFKRMLLHGRTVGTTRIHVFYQDNLAGKNAFNAISKSAPQVGYTEVGGTEAKIDASSLALAAKAVNTAEPQTVIIVGQPRFLIDGVKQLRESGYSRSILSTSYMSVPILVKLAGPAAARGVGIVQTFPNPTGRTLPLHQDFQRTMSTFAPDVKTYTSFHLEGYLSARVLVDALKRAKGNTSAEALTAALRGAGELNYGGFRVDFSKSNIGSTWTDISVIDAFGTLRY